MKKDSISYLRMLALGFVAVVLGNVAFNVMIDTYGIVGTPRWKGVNAEKFGVDRHARVAKAYQVRDYHPDAAIFGSSRAESAFDPLHSYFAGYKTYNLAFPGAAVYEEYRYLQHVAALGKLQRAIVALDFFQFLDSSQKLAPDFREDRLLLTENGRRQIFPWLDVLSLMASGGAFKESWRGLKMQRKQTSIYRADGYRDDSDDIPLMLRQRGGQAYEFIASEKGYVRVYRGRGSALTNFSTIQRDPYQDVRAMRDLSEAANFELALILPPVHVRHLALIDMLGLWSRFEEWKRELVRVLADGRNGHKCLLWDFSTINQMTMESIPPNGSGKQMRWWRESSHATRAMGALTLDTILAGNNSEVGVCLDAGNVDEYLALQLELLKAWEGSNSAAMTELQEVVINAR